MNSNLSDPRPHVLFPHCASSLDWSPRGEVGERQGAPMFVGPRAAACTVPSSSRGRGARGRGGRPCARPVRTLLPAPYFQPPFFSSSQTVSRRGQGLVPQPLCPTCPRCGGVVEESTPDQKTGELVDINSATNWLCDLGHSHNPQASTSPEK